MTKKRKIIVFSILGSVTLLIIIAVIFSICFYLSFKNFDPLEIGKDKSKDDFPAILSSDIVEYEGNLYKYNDDIVNILFIGMDNDADDIIVPNQIISSGGQADVMILLSIDTLNNKFFMFNIYRDCMTDISVYDAFGQYVGNEVSQIALAHAYGDGGTRSAKLTQQAVSAMLSNLKIYRYIRLNIEGLIKATDIIGGVEVTLPEDIKILNVDYKSGQRIKMNGNQTELYLRYRDHNNLESSLDRSARHMHFINELFPQMAGKIKGDPLSILNIYNRLEKYVNTDLSIQELSYVLQTLDNSSFDTKKTLQIPGAMKKGEKFAEFIVDKSKLYDIIISEYYYLLPDDEVKTN